VQMAKHSEKPLFAIVLLMSSHFEYEYPPQYEIDTPVSKTTWHVTSVRTLGPEDELPHRNRYRNCVRFIDDLVAGAIQQLDPARNLVVFTGDHGESINDDGRYTHGYSFAEIITRTPFAMVGPGVAPGRLAQPTYHMDVLPSLVHVLAGRHISIPHIQGRDWFAEPARSSALLAHTLINAGLVQTQLRTEGVRLRIDLELREPQITLLGFEDALGHLIATPALSPATEDRLVGSFEEQLSLLRR
jgi:membrane-anchored protein YejM (alkaline phosphatase superfamily)